MRIRVFGLEEAKRASEFAKTDEQRNTVLAVTRMFNIPIVVKQQAQKAINKFEVAFKKKRVKIRNLDVKVSKLESRAKADVLRKYEAVEIRDNWNF